MESSRNTTPTSPPATTLAVLDLASYRIEGVSVAGEQTMVRVPELGVCFDIGLCPRPALQSPYVALTHGHIDHTGGLMYWFAHRHIHGAPGTVICDPSLEGPIRQMMQASEAMAGERTAFEIVPMEPEEEHPLDADHVLRAFRTQHTVPSLGFVVLRGGEPVVCYTGDTAWGPQFQRSDVQQARLLITECTFWDTSHRPHALRTGHMHLSDVVSLMELVDAEAVVLTHVGRRLGLERARKLLDHALPARHQGRAHVLMEGWAENGVPFPAL